MNIFEICNYANISLAKAREIERAGYLISDQNEAPEEEIIYWLRHGSHLTVRHLLMLLENPRLLDLLRSQERKAREQLNEVGPAREEAAPAHVVSCIAARNLNPEAVATLVTWLRSVLPTHPVSHYWIALRMVFGLPEDAREKASGYVRFALMQCRKHPDFSGWWRPVKYMRTQTIYQRPAMMFDL